MTGKERRLLAELRLALLHLHKTLLDWERASYERVHGRMSPSNLLQVIVSDPQFAWLRPISELIVRIDTALETEAPDTPVELDPIIIHARSVVAPEDPGSAERYHAALQEVTEAVIAHGAVTKLLKDVPTRETLH